MNRKYKLLSSFVAIIMLLGMIPAMSVSAANPFLPQWERIPDGEPYVFEDPDNPGQYRVYLYGSQDGNDPTIYCGWRHVVWSAPVDDLNNWRYDGLAFDRDWVQGKNGPGGVPFYYTHPATALYAPDVAYNPVTKKYYMYVFLIQPDNSGNINTGYYNGTVANGDMYARCFVGESDSPAGPFNENIRWVDAGWHPEGHPNYGEPFGNGKAGLTRPDLPAGNTTDHTNTLHPGPFDPAILVDVTDWDEDGNPTDFRAYIYWGFTCPWAAELEKDMATIKRDTIVAGAGLLPNAGTGGNNAARYFEGPSIRKIDDQYVFVYCANNGPRLNYAVGDNPLGPFTYKGQLLYNGGETVPNPYGTNTTTQFRSGNNHGGMFEADGQWYIVGHNHTGDPWNASLYQRFPTQDKRQAIVAPLKKYVDESGDVAFEQGMLTSMGFELDGLNPYKEYDASTICYQVPNSANNAYNRVRNFDENDWLNKYEYQYLKGMDWNPVVIRNRGNVRIGWRYYNFGEGIPSSDADMSFVLTLKGSANAEFTSRGRTVNVYVQDAKEKAGDPEAPHYLIGTGTLTGNANVHTLEIPITSNRDMLVGKKAIYLEFLQGDAPQSSGTASTNYNDILVEVNKVQFVIDSDISLTTAAHNIKAGDYFTMNASFKKTQGSNAVVLGYSFDGDKFEYASYTAADGVGLVDAQYGDGYAKITLMVKDYNAKDLGDIILRAKENAQLNREKQTVSLAAEYVIKKDNVKTISNAVDSASFTTLGGKNGEPAIPGDTNDDGVLDIIDLSNMIDWFGTTDENLGWDDLHIYFDFNNNGEIDINDISYVARLI